MFCIAYQFAYRMKIMPHYEGFTCRQSHFQLGFFHHHLSNIDIGPLHTHNSAHIVCEDVRLLDVFYCALFAFIFLFFQVEKKQIAFFFPFIWNSQKHTVQKTVHFHVQKLTQRVESKKMQASHTHTHTRRACRDCYSGWFIT